MKHFFTLLLIVLLFCGACSAAPPETSSAKTPAFTAGADARVVALSRSVGELWLLAGGRLAGVTEDAMDLEGISADTALIGSLSRPSREAILGCRPDLVMLTEDLSAHKTLAEQLRADGIPVMTVDIESFQDYADVMKELTDMTGRSDLYEANCTAVKAQIDGILKEAAGSPGGTYLCMRVSATKNKVLKNDHFACAMLNDLGLTNIAADGGALDELNLEAIVAADPDRIFVVLQGAEDEAMAVYRDAFTAQTVWKDLTAVREDRVSILPKDLFQYKPNARWAEAYQYLFDIIRG